MKDTFNDNLYVTAATVIPVLYLALTLQGSMFRNVLLRLDGAIKKISTAKPEPRLAAQFRVLAEQLLAYVLIAAGGAILFASVIGEMVAILALVNQSATIAQRDLVEFSTMGLLCAAALGPAWGLTNAYARLQWALLVQSARIVEDVFGTIRTTVQQRAQGEATPSLQNGEAENVRRV